MKRFITIAATLVLAAVTFAQGTGVLRYWKDVDRAPGKDEEILSFSLDRDLYAATRDGMPDLRIFDNDGTAVPYLIETQLQDREEKVRQEFSTEIVHLRPSGNAPELRCYAEAGSQERANQLSAQCLRILENMKFF